MDIVHVPWPLLARVQVIGLGAGDVLRVGYLDMSMDVVDSAEATILVDFMTGGRCAASSLFHSYYYLYFV